MRISDWSSDVCSSDLFIVVRDADKRAQLGEWYRQGFQMVYGNPEAVVSALSQDDPAYVDTTRRVIDSATYLSEHMAEVPVLVIPVIEGRTDNEPVIMQASIWGSLFPAVWSFMLAARARGLGPCWTSLHMVFEQQSNELLGLPANVMQGAMIPVAPPIGTTSNPAPH